MSDPQPAPEAGAQHLYNSAAFQKDKVVGDFADQREVLKRAVEDQRLSAMPEHMRRAALGPSAEVSVEIVRVLRQIISKEVTRQLDLAIRTMIEQQGGQAQPPG